MTFRFLTRIIRMSFSDTYLSTICRPRRFPRLVLPYTLYRCNALARDRFLDQERASFSVKSFVVEGPARWSIAKKIELSLSRLLHVLPLRRWDFLRFVARQVWKKIALHSDVRRRLMYKVWQCRIHDGTGEQGDERAFGHYFHSPSPSLFLFLQLGKLKLSRGLRRDIILPTLCLR